MSTWVWLGIYSLLIMFASLAGGALPTKVHMTHTRTQLVMSFVGGFMLGVGLLHLLPHAAAETHSLDVAVIWALAGLLSMFFLIRMFHFHEHGSAESIVLPHNEPHAETTNHDHTHAHAHPHQGPHRFSWAGLAIGMVVHSLIDGVALAAALAPAEHLPGATGLVGAAVFLAIVLHKPLDAMSITMVMTASGASLAWTRAVNFLFAWVCPLGAILFFLGAQQASEMQSMFVGGALGFSAGVFLCIALSDLLPELQFHSHDRGKLSAALLGGVALAYTVGFIEPHGLHGHDESSHSHTRDDEHQAAHEHAPHSEDEHRHATSP